jgi:hypothetical protein
LLIRTKKGKDADTRLEDIFNDPVRMHFCDPLARKFVSVKETSSAHVSCLKYEKKPCIHSEHLPLLMPLPVTQYTFLSVATVYIYIYICVCVCVLRW